MNTPLTLEQMLDIFEVYNLAIWPMQVVAYLLGIVAVYLAIKTTPNSSKIILAILTFLWLWIGIVFCILYWGPAYKPAYGFAVLLIIQGVLFFPNILQPRISFHFETNVYSVMGILFIAYAMLGYPLVGHLLDHNYPQMLPFGLVPCPTTVFTFGLLLLTDKKVPKSLLVIPFLLSLSAFVPVSLGIWEDFGLIISGFLGTAMILFRDSRRLG